MRSKGKLEAVVNEIFVRLYEEAMPPASYPNEVVSYQDHYLDHSRQLEIFNEVCKLRRLSPAEKKQVSMAVHLGPSPNTAPIYVKERVF